MNIYDKKLSVVMPAYNEGEFIYQNLLTTVNILKEFHHNFEIIAVDDGSLDDTGWEMNQAAEKDKRIIVISYQPNAGKGKAIKEGVLKATGEYIAFLDSDLDLSPLHIKDFLGKMEETQADAVIGSKLHRDSRVGYPKRRKLMSFGYYLVLVCLFHLPVKDTQTGVKLFQAAGLKEIIQRVQCAGYAYDIEILANISIKGGRIEEMPITLEFTRECRWGRIRLKDVLDVMIETMNVYKYVYKR